MIFTEKIIFSSHQKEKKQHAKKQKKYKIIAKREKEKQRKKEGVGDREKREERKKEKRKK